MCSVDVLADFVHEMRQPLGALEALASYLELIVPDDRRVQEQLGKMHAEIAHADRVLSDGMQRLRGYLLAGSRVPVRRAADSAAAVEDLSAPLTSAAMSSVTH